MSGSMGPAAMATISKSRRGSSASRAARAQDGIEREIAGPGAGGRTGRVREPSSGLPSDSRAINCGVIVGSIPEKFSGESRASLMVRDRWRLAPLDLHSPQGPHERAAGPVGRAGSRPRTGSAVHPVADHGGEQGGTFGIAPLESSANRTTGDRRSSDEGVPARPDAPAGGLRVVRPHAAGRPRQRPRSDNTGNRRASSPTWIGNGRRTRSRGNFRMYRHSDSNRLSSALYGTGALLITLAGLDHAPRRPACPARNAAQGPSCPLPMGRAIRRRLVCPISRTAVSAASAGCEVRVAADEDLLRRR